MKSKCVWIKKNKKQMDLYQNLNLMFKAKEKKDRFKS